VPELGEIEGPDPGPDDELPHSPGYEVPPDDVGPIVGPPEPPPFEASPQPPIEAVGQPDVQAAIALADNPVVKLQAFLAANPDVVTLIENYTPPEPEPKATP
jgi:hypothetical protein